MPKRSKSTRSSSKLRGAVPQWPTANRLEYHLAEISVHLMMVEQIVTEEKIGNPSEILQHRKQLGMRLKVLYKLLRKEFPEMNKQP